MSKKIFLTLFILLSIAGCRFVPVESVNEIVVNHESPGIYVETGEIATIHLNKSIPFGSAEANPLKLIVTNSTITDIEGEVLSGSGMCLSSEGEKFHCYLIEDIEGQVLRVETLDIERIEVFKKTQTIEMTKAGKVTLWTIAILLIFAAAGEACGADIGDCFGGFVP